MPLRTFATSCAQSALIAVGAYAALWAVFFFGQLVAPVHTSANKQTPVQAAKGR